MINAAIEHAYPSYGLNAFGMQTAKRKLSRLY
jgi:hypothetical protein